MHNLQNKKFLNDSHIQDINHFTHGDMKYFIYRRKGCKSWLMGNFNLNMTNIELNTTYLGNAKRKAEQIIENSLSNMKKNNPMKRIFNLIRHSI